MITPQWYLRKLCDILELIIDWIPGAEQLKTLKDAIVLLRHASSIGDVTYLLKEILIALTQLGLQYAGYWYISMLIKAAITIIKILL